MSYKSIRMPEEFIKEVKEVADKEYRTIPQQIMYWAELSKQAELRKWQLDEMQKGLDQADQGLLVDESTAKDIFNKCRAKI